MTTSSSGAINCGKNSVVLKYLYSDDIRRRLLEGIDTATDGLHQLSQGLQYSRCSLHITGSILRCKLTIRQTDNPFTLTYVVVNAPWYESRRVRNLLQ